MKRSQAFPGNYLAKEDVTDAVTAIIATVAMEPVREDNGDRMKPVLRFAQDQLRPLILNNVNWDTLEHAYGDDSDAWLGRPVEIYCDPSVMFGGRRVGGVRVRVPREAPPAKPAEGPPHATEAQHKLAMECFSTATTPERLEACMARSKQLRWEHWQIEEQHAAYHARKKALTRPVQQPAVR